MYKTLLRADRGQVSGGNKQTFDFINTWQATSLSYFSVLYGWERAKLREPGGPTVPLASPVQNFCQVRDDTVSVWQLLPAKIWFSLITISHFSKGQIFTCWAPHAVGCLCPCMIIIFSKSCRRREFNCLSSALCLPSKREQSTRPHTDRWAQRTSFIWFNPYKHSRVDLYLIIHALRNPFWLVHSLGCLNSGYICKT